MNLGTLGLLLILVGGAGLALVCVSIRTGVPVRCLLGRHPWEYSCYLGNETRYCPDCHRFEERGLGHGCQPCTPWKKRKKWK